MCSCFGGLAYLLSAVSNNLFCNGVILSGALGAHATEYSWGAKRSQRGPKGHPLGISPNAAKPPNSV